MPFRSEMAFPDALNLDGTGEFMLDLFLHEELGIRIPVPPDKTLFGKLKGHRLLALLKEDTECDVEGIDKILENCRNILAGEIVVDGNETISTLDLDGITNPLLLRKIVPDYPAVARSRGATGTVSLLAFIYEDGSVGEIEITDCSKPGVGFEKVAVQAVRRWRYRPARQHGIPTVVWFQIEVNFTIH